MASLFYSRQVASHLYVANLKSSLHLVNTYCSSSTARLDWTYYPWASSLAIPCKVVTHKALAPTYLSLEPSPASLSLFSSLWGCVEAFSTFLNFCLASPLSSATSLNCCSLCSIVRSPACQSFLCPRCP